MNYSQIGARYAKALYLLGNERNKLELLYTDMKHLGTTIQEADGFQFFLTNPSIKPSLKKETLTTLFQDSYTAETLSFIHLVISNGREKYLKDICRSFASLYRKKNQIARVSLTTTEPMDSTLLEEFREILGKQINKKIELDNQVDSQILGGALIKLDDYLYDASFVRKLKHIKTTLLKTDI